MTTETTDARSREITDARTALKARQVAHRDHHEGIAAMKRAIADAETSVRDAERELGEIAATIAMSDKTRIAALKAGADAAAIGAERRAALERQNELRDNLTGAQTALELLRTELAAEEAKTEKHNDAVAYAAEKLFVLQLDEVARELNEDIRRLRDEWLEVRAICDHATVPHWRGVLGSPDPIRAPRGLKYGRQTDLLMDAAIGQNKPFNQVEFSALGSKWAGFFQRLQADADAVMPALGQPA